MSVERRSVQEGVEKTHTIRSETSTAEQAATPSRRDVHAGARTDGSAPIQIPLVVTPQSLSRKTAIGTQSRLLMKGVPRWNHVFWDEVENRGSRAHSNRIESKLFGRISFFKRDSLPAAARLLGAGGLSWWDGNRLKTAKAKWLRLNYHDQTSVAFAAVCSLRDGERTCSILSTLDRPFLLHFWDLLDPDQRDAESTRWLVQNAAHVFCCSNPIREALRALRSDISILRFRREPSRWLAKEPRDGVLRIGLIGQCLTYTDGLSLLNDALRLVRAAGVKVEVRYVGGRKQMERWKSCLAEGLQATGFLDSDDARDRALAECHAGYLPGPLASPAADTRSRYSIPSRILDFLATGLPFAAAVHRDSATAEYLESLGLGTCMMGCRAESLAERLLEVTRGDAWRAHANSSREAFCTAVRDQGELAPWFERFAESDFA